MNMICNVKIPKAALEEAKAALDAKIDEAYFRKQEIADEKKRIGEEYTKFQEGKKEYYDNKLEEAKKASEDELAAYVKMIDDSNTGRKAYQKAVAGGQTE